VPVPLVVGIGLEFAPVAHAGALYQGAVPFGVACLAAVVLGERVPFVGKVGLLLIACGAATIGGVGWSSLSGRQSIGHVLFLSSALMTASYTVAMRRARTDGLHAAAMAAVVSMLFYLPVYFVFFGEWPSSDVWVAILAIASGVYLASGGPLPTFRLGMLT
jgi:drug/metabolite transporter (DMT)-like permease